MEKSIFIILTVFILSGCWVVDEYVEIPPDKVQSDSEEVVFHQYSLDIWCRHRAIMNAIAAKEERGNPVFIERGSLNGENHAVAIEMIGDKKYYIKLVDNYNSEVVDRIVGFVPREDKSLYTIYEYVDLVLGRNRSESELKFSMDF
jgi:hypothetical protein